MAAGDVYASIQLAFDDGSTPPIAGDFIYVDSVHSHSTSVAIRYGLATVPSVNVVSVNTAEADEYLAGAKETCTSTSNDVHLSNVSSGGVNYSGIDFSTSDNFTCIGAAIINNSTLTLTGSADIFSLGTDGGNLELNDSTVVFTAGTTVGMFTVSNGNQLVCNNVVFDDGSGTLNDFTRLGGTNGGYTISLNECDLSQVTGFMCGEFGNDAATDDNIDFRMSNCQMNATKLFVEEVFSSPGMFFLATNCSDVSAEAEYQFFQRTWAGDVEDSGDDGTSGGIYRSETTAFTNGNKVSFKITTSANASLGAPLHFDMPAVFADLSDAGSNEVTIYFAVATATTLTDTNFWAVISYPDGTNKQIWNTVDNRNSDIIAVGTTHTDDSGSSTWEDAGVDLTGHNEYRMTIDTSGDAGSEGVPRIRIFTTLPSETIYVDTTVGLS